MGGGNVGAGQMATHPPLPGRAAELTGRRSERDVLDRLIEAVRAGQSRALVVRGEAGVGKTALLDYIVEHASGCRVARAAGIQSEMELAFAALHQLLAPMLDRLEHLPVPQRDALRTAFGLSPGPAPDRFLVALAVLSLLFDVAEEQPLICLVDDEQWLDRASAQALAFVARRLEAEAVGLVFAARDCARSLPSVPARLRAVIIIIQQLLAEAADGIGQEFVSVDAREPDALRPRAGAGCGHCDPPRSGRRFDRLEGRVLGSQGRAGSVC